MMVKRLLRLGALTPVLLLAVLPVAASADSGLAVSVGAPATRASPGTLLGPHYQPIAIWHAQSYPGERKLECRCWRCDARLRR